MTRRLAVDSVAHSSQAQSHDAYSHRRRSIYAMGFRLAFDVVDLIWSEMRDGEFYSPNDLANSLEQPVESVTRVLEFLKKYKFAEQVTRHEMIFRKVTNNPSPGDALRVLQTVIGDVRVERTERANVSEAHKGFNAFP